MLETKLYIYIYIGSVFKGGGGWEQKAKLKFKQFHGFQLQSLPSPNLPASLDTSSWASSTREVALEPDVGAHDDFL